MVKYWEFKNIFSNEAELYIYGEIASFSWDDSSTSANMFKSELDNIGEGTELNIYLNSPGGEVFEGIAIGNMIKRRKGKTKCIVDALAASIATVIAASCDEVVMYANSMMMVHNALTAVYGNSKDLIKMAEDLDRITESIKETYLDKCKGKVSKDKFTELMDKETWLSAKEAYDLGLCDSIIEENRMVACADPKVLKNYKNVPKKFKDSSFLNAQKPIKSKIAEEVKAMEGYENFGKNIYKSNQIFN